TLALKKLPLTRINPFRLIGVFNNTHEIVEWRWNLKELVSEHYHWATRQWISSGFDEPGAQIVRSRTFQKARRQKSTGSLDWLRRLHRSHTPHSGPYSTCMHREGAATVSYTEVIVSPRGISMGYVSSPPCGGQTQILKKLLRSKFARPEI